MLCIQCDLLDKAAAPVPSVLMPPISNEPDSMACCGICGAPCIKHGDTLTIETPFVLSESEMRAVVRQTYHQYIPTEGSSGPVLSALLARIRAHVGRKAYDAFTAEPMKGGKHG